MEHGWVNVPLASTPRTSDHRTVEPHQSLSISEIKQQFHQIRERSEKRKNTAPSRKRDPITSDLLSTSMEQFEHLASSFEVDQPEEIEALALNLAEIKFQGYEFILVDEFDILETEISPQALPSIPEWDVIPRAEVCHIRDQDWMEGFSFDASDPFDHSAFTLSSQPLLPSNGHLIKMPVERKRRGHTKPRSGCTTCKRRKIKCQEQWKSCEHCIKSRFPIGRPTCFRHAQPDRRFSDFLYIYMNIYMYICSRLTVSGAVGKDYREAVYKEETHPTLSQMRQIHDIIQLTSSIIKKRTKRWTRWEAPKNNRLSSDQIATTRHSQSEAISEDAEASNLLGRNSVQKWKEHSGKSKSWKRAPTQKYKGKQRHTTSYNALPSVLEQQSRGPGKASTNIESGKINAPQERTRKSKRAPKPMVYDVLQEWNYPSQNMPFIRLDSGVYTDTRLQLIPKKERRVRQSSKPLPTFVRPSPSVCQSQSKKDPSKPNGYKSLSKSGKRRIRKKLQTNKYKEEEVFPVRVETKPEKTAVPKRIIQWRNRKLKRGTDPFQHCYGVWHGFSCGHNYRVLCPSCDHGWNEGVSQKCILIQCLETSSDLFVDAISIGDIFFPHPCVICPWYDYPALPKDSVSVRVVSKKLPIRRGAQKSPGPTFWPDQFKRKDIICRFCVKRNHPMVLSLFSDYWMSWMEGEVSRHYRPAHPDPPPLLDIVTTCKDIRAIPRSEIHGADENRPLYCPECGTTWFALRTHDTKRYEQYIVETSSACREVGEDTVN